MSQSTQKPILIKKYANRRLYNTQTSSYVTLDDLYDMVREGQDFEVRDAKSEEDLTRSVLTQIIIERETRGGEALLPINVLKSLISYYDNNTNKVFPHYLEAAMQWFNRNQEQLQEFVLEAAQRPMDNFSNLQEQQQRAIEQQRQAMEQLEAITRQNVTLFQQAFTMFNPFSAMQAGQDKANKK